MGAIRIVYPDDFPPRGLCSNHRQIVKWFPASPLECVMQEMVEKVPEVSLSCRNCSEEMG